MYILLQIDKSGNKTHLMINTTISIIKSKLEYIMIPSDFFIFSLELLGEKLNKNGYKIITFSLKCSSAQQRETS